MDWFAIIFNPSFPYRFAHMVCAAYITTGFVVLSVGAWLIRKGRFAEEGRVMFSITLWLLLALVPLQIFLGDQHGLNTLEHQPAKLAAIEGDFTTETPTPLNLFAIPDQNAATNRFDIAIPRLGSIILAHSWSGTVRGLDQFPREDWPMVIFPFFAFRIMVTVGLLMLTLVVWGNWMRRGERLFSNARLLRVFEFAAPLGFIAVIAGWVTTETGRQPWSLLCYIIAYAIIFPSGWIVMSRIVRHGPEAMVAEDDEVESGRPGHPITELPTSRAGTAVR